ncbi:ATP-dependent helicase, partial [Paenibacillus riograndensis]
VVRGRVEVDRMRTLTLCESAADERGGRDGWTAEGDGYRVWGREGQASLQDDRVQEIMETELAQLALERALWGVPAPEALLWLAAPPAAPYAQGTALLRQVGALDAGGAITPHGRSMAALGAHPRVAPMLLRAAELGAAPLACRLAALLQERDLLRGPAARDSDLTLRVEALLRFERSAADSGGADAAALRAVQRESRSFLAQLSAAPGALPDNISLPGLLLSFPYPDRIGQKRGDGAFLLSGGRGAAMREGQPLTRSPYNVAAGIDDRAGQSRIMIAADLPEADLLKDHKDSLQEEREVYWDRESGSVQARRRTLLGALILKETSHERPTAEETEEVLLRVIAEEGLKLLPWDKATVQLRQRMEFLHGLRPDFPDVSEEALLSTLQEWLLPFIQGMRNLRDLQRVPVSRALEGLLDWNSRQLLDREAPAHITVPSGSRIPVDYSSPSAPVLAVRLQEMFGQADTPRLGGGKVAVLLHLLPPARRPVQVTAELSSFWRSTYFEVKKDLTGRYPKQYWPDDPLQAAPTNRTRPAK